METSTVNTAARPDLSLIMPCYNEEDNVGYTIPKLVAAFSDSGCRLQLVAVNNGSRDGTSAALDELAHRYPQLRVITVEHNVGFGYGILAGVPSCDGYWIGIVTADGQVDAEDVVRLYDAAASCRGAVLAKARRRFRMDGLTRKVVSVAYNMLVRLLWPRLGSWDVNGTPVLLQHDVLLAMRLESINWFLNPELLIKAHYLGVRVLELNVFARMRGNGLSHVRASTCWEFLRSLVAYRFRSRPPWLQLPEGLRPGTREHSASSAELST